MPIFEHSLALWHSFWKLVFERVTHGINLPVEAAGVADLESFELVTAFAEASGHGFEVLVKAGRLNVDGGIGHGAKVVDLDVEVLDVLEVLKHDEAWRFWWVAPWIVAAPEWVDTLPFHGYEEEVLAEESVVGFFMDLLVGEQEAHGLHDESANPNVSRSNDSELDQDDKRIAFVTTWHEADFLVVVVQGILPPEVTKWCAGCCHNLIVDQLIRGVKASYEQLVVDFVADLFEWLTQWEARPLYSTYLTRQAQKRRVALLRREIVHASGHVCCGWGVFRCQVRCLRALALFL